jgi:hypothetical protein
VGFFLCEQSLREGLKAGPRVKPGVTTCRARGDKLAVIPDLLTVIPDSLTVIPDLLTVIPDSLTVIPDLIRDPVFSVRHLNLHLTRVFLFW